MVKTTRQHGRWLTVGVLSLLLAAAALSACGSDEGSFNDNRGWGDAPIAGRDDTGAWIVNSPNLFPNVAIKCDGRYGYMVFTVTHAITDVAPVVVPDPRCPGYRDDLRTPVSVPGGGAPPAKEE